MEQLHCGQPLAKPYRSASNTIIVASGRISQVGARKFCANVYEGRPPPKPNKGRNRYISRPCGAGKPNSGSSQKPMEPNFSWTCTGNDVVARDSALEPIFWQQYGNTPMRRSGFEERPGSSEVVRTWRTFEYSPDGRALRRADAGLPEHQLTTLTGLVRVCC